MNWEDLVVWYVAGPYRSKIGAYGILKNIDKARDVGVDLIKLGIVPSIPHLNTALFDNAADDSVWLQGDLVMISRSGALVTVEGWEDSSGTRDEVDYCRGADKNVYHSQGRFSSLDELKLDIEAPTRTVKLPDLQLAGVIGPYNCGLIGLQGREQNIHKAQLRALEIWNQNIPTFCPQKNFAHLDYFLDDHGPGTRQQYVFAALNRCDFAVTMDDWRNDKHAREQVEFCKGLNISVYQPEGKFTGIENCLEL
ncbi:MAG: hypothetical protein ACE5FT_05795 [Candidatus Nanoarchaeia archaeon]